jgi:cytochrome c peroxidase
MSKTPLLCMFAGVVFLATTAIQMSGQDHSARDRTGGDRNSGKRLFERETFGGNGRTCLTCHSRETGTVSPEDAQMRLLDDPHDPLFVHDGSDDGLGDGVTRMLSDATILVQVPLPANVELGDDPDAGSVVLARGIPTTLNTPALDPVLMLDGRQQSLQAQAAGAILDHAQPTEVPTAKELDRIAEFQKTDAFFSSGALRNFALGGPAQGLPEGRTASERRGRRFFEDVPPDPADGFTSGSCASCHSGPLMNQTNEFLPLFAALPIPAGTRFQTVLVSELNAAGNPVRDFVFTNPDGSQTTISSPDPGRALITGVSTDTVIDDLPLFDNVNAFKIPQLRGVRHTAPYFHDNSAKTLEDVAAHYTLFFAIVTNGGVILTEQDEADIVAFMKRL